MTKFPDLFAQLCKPFHEDDVKARNQGGRQVQYITARTVMNCLDSVLGPENWWDEYLPGENSVLCRLTIRLPDGSTLTKADAGGYAGMADQGDDDKSGFSDAFKRAAVKFGVGRYLYRDGFPSFEAGENRPPAAVAAPAEPTPASRPRPTPPSPPPAPANPKPVPGPGEWENAAGQTAGKKGPKSGRALYAWVMEQEQRHGVGLNKYLQSWGKLQDFPGRMVDWNADEIAQGHAEAVRKLQSIAPRGDAYEEAA